MRKPAAILASVVLLLLGPPAAADERNVPDPSRCIEYVKKFLEGPSGEDNNPCTEFTGDTVTYANELLVETYERVQSEVLPLVCVTDVIVFATRLSETTTEGRSRGTIDCGEQRATLHVGASIESLTKDENGNYPSNWRDSGEVLVRSWTTDTNWVRVVTHPDYYPIVHAYEGQAYGHSQPPHTGNTTATKANGA